MSESRRELLLAEITARLDAIRGDETYSLGRTLYSVQRYRHWVSDSDEEGNQLAHLPTIIVRPENEGPNDCTTIGFWDETLPIDIGIYLPTPVEDRDLNRALADVKRALYQGDVGFGVNFALHQVQAVLVEPKTGMPLDGLHFRLTGTFLEPIGAPGS